MQLYIYICREKTRLHTNITQKKLLRARSLSRASGPSTARPSPSPAQDAAEFLDNSRAEAYTASSANAESAEAAAAAASMTSARTPPPPMRSVSGGSSSSTGRGGSGVDSSAVTDASSIRTPQMQQKQPSKGEGHTKSFATPLYSAIADGGVSPAGPLAAAAPVSDSSERGGGGSSVDNGWGDTGQGLGGKLGSLPAGGSIGLGGEEPVRVVATCSTSDRGILSLCGRCVEH